MKIPILILGGGLAGLTAAVHLSKLGHQVTVVEKNTYPKHKVCGEYISNEVVLYYKWLGLDTIVQQSNSITDFKLEVSAKNVAQVKLPMGGFGISRYLLDDLLYQKAIEQGCQFIQEAVNQISFENSIFTVKLNAGLEIKASIVLGSFGKRSSIDIQLNRSFIQKKSHWMAVKSHYNGIFPDDRVGLYPFDGGYCGVSKVEKDVLNICYIVKTTTFKRCKTISEFQNQILTKNEGLKTLLQNAKPIFEKPLTISQISFESKKAVENNIIMIGDAAGLIHPLCGNGMAMAIHSAKIASDLIHEALKKEHFNRIDLENAYQDKWNKTFKNRLMMGKLLSKLLLNPFLTNVCLKTIAKHPYLLRFIIAKTHGKLIPAPSL